MATSQIDRRAEARLDSRYAQESATADRQAARRRELSRLPGGRREAGAGAEASARAQPGELVEREGRLREEVLADSARAAEAAHFVAGADERERRSGSRWSAGELAQTRELIRREADRPIESGVHAWRVGMEGDRYEALSGRERVEAQRLVARELREDRLALGAIPDRPEGVLDRGGGRAYRRELIGGGGREARARLRSETTHARRERLHAERPRQLAEGGEPLSSRARTWVLATACLGVVGAMVLIAREPSAIGPGQAARDPGEVELRSVANRLADAEQGRAARRLREQARAERPRAEPGPTRRAAGLSGRERAEAVAVARRFHRAFARLELGRGGASEIHAAATPGFARALLAEPPRMLVEAKPAKGLSALQVASVGESPARALELVGRQRRGGRWEPIAIDVERVRGSWRVAGLGL